MSDSIPADALQQETAISDTSLSPAPVVFLSQPSPSWSPASDSSEPLATQLPLIHLDDETLSDVMNKDSVDTTNPSDSSDDIGGDSVDSKVLPDPDEPQHECDDDVSAPPPTIMQSLTLRIMTLLLKKVSCQSMSAFFNLKNC